MSEDSKHFNRKPSLLKWTSILCFFFLLSYGIFEGIHHLKYRCTIIFKENVHVVLLVTLYLSLSISLYLSLSLSLSLFLAVKRSVYQCCWYWNYFKLSVQQKPARFSKIIKKWKKKKFKLKEKKKRKQKQFVIIRLLWPIICQRGMK